MSAPRKPRDVGNGLVAASFGSGGEWLSLSTVHPQSGYVELNGLPRFAPEWRGDPDEVRRYRSWMRRDEHAFLHVEAGRATIRTRQDAPRNTRGVVQRLVISATLRDRPAGIRLRFNGRLGPPAYPEISEVAPPATESGLKSRVKAQEGTLRVVGEGGPIVVQAWLRTPGPRTTDPGTTDPGTTDPGTTDPGTIDPDPGTTDPDPSTTDPDPATTDTDPGPSASAPDSATTRHPDQRIEWRVLRRTMPSAAAWIDWPGDAAEVHIDLACTFEAPPPSVPDWLEAARISPPERPADQAPVELRPLQVPARLVKTIGRMDRKAASYTRGCTALALDDAQRCILADHRILPLSWTRDAYWQARLLLATWSRGGHDDDERLVADHLRWLFLRCERPDGRWVRSHYADGRRKDPPLQSDQQLYPLLELADYVDATGRLPDLPPDTDWPTLVGSAWSAALETVDPQLGLVRTAENAADDVPRYPFLLSDQVLLFRTASRLAGIADDIGLDRTALTELAARVRTTAIERFAAEGPLGPMWAYAINGRGGLDRYMDANDLPAALAPLWGFCPPDDPAWQTTMRFAFDPENPGFVQGPMGGLGSRHTPGTWTLGDIMGWVAFGLVGDEAASEAALERLVRSAFADGMLPEAYDPEGSGAAVRHWFAWPGAALGALVIDHAARDTGEGE